MVKKIIHIDMDCFYAAIEVRDNPKLIGLPVAVGGDASRRGVLCTCNYVARKFGVRSAMATAKAYQLCPDLVVLPVDMDKYRSVGVKVREIFERHTDRIEPLSLDEAFLDVTGSIQCHGSATWLASKIRQQILDELALEASAGIAPNKFLAKIASDWRKPNGQFTIAPTQIEAFMKILPVGKIFGVGKVTLKKLNQMNVFNCHDLQQKTLITLTQAFGTFGNRLYELCRGIDNREVISDRKRKSISVENTFSQDLISLSECIENMLLLIPKLKKRCEQKAENILKAVFVKIKFNDFTQTTAECFSKTIAPETLKTLMELAFKRKQKPIRLIGIGVRLEQNTEQQLNLHLS